VFRRSIPKAVSITPHPHNGLSLALQDPSCCIIPPSPTLVGVFLASILSCTLQPKSSPTNRSKGLLGLALSLSPPAYFHLNLSTQIPPYPTFNTLPMARTALLHLTVGAWLIPSTICFLLFRDELMIPFMCTMW